MEWRLDHLWMSALVIVKEKDERFNLSRDFFRWSKSKSMNEVPAVGTALGSEVVTAIGLWVESKDGMDVIGSEEGFPVGLNVGSMVGSKDVGFEVESEVVGWAVFGWAVVVVKLPVWFTNMKKIDFIDINMTANNVTADMWAHVPP